MATVINKELRDKTLASLKPEQKPTTIFKYYLVFKYSFANYSVLGYDEKETALALQQDYIRKGALDAGDPLPEFPQPKIKTPKMYKDLIESTIQGRKK